jgi:hypothetical protein
MAHARKSSISPIGANAVFKDQMAAFDLGTYAVTEKSYHSLPRRDDRAEIAVIGVLR